jgi:hypothetical protein
MGRKARIEQKLDELLALQKASQTVVKLLVENNKKLMDRLMAKDFRELQVYSAPEPEVSRSPVPLDTIEFAGEVLDGRDLEE